MNRGHGSVLLAQALETLRRLDYEVGDGELSVEICMADNGIRLRFSGRAKHVAIPGKSRVVMPDKPQESPAAWHWLSPLEEGIVRATGREGWTTAEKIAAACGEPLNTDIRVVLRNLVERNILVSSPSRGYRLNMTSGERVSGKDDCE